MRGDDRMRTSVLLLTLAAIAVLAVLPFGGVQWLHARRLHSADRDIGVLAAGLDLSAVRRGLPDGIAVLMGPGDTPRAEDALWVTGTTFPLSRIEPLARPDPWGNAYVVNIAAGRAGMAAVWVLSAGPDGVIETPFRQAGSGAMPSGDDRAARLHGATSGLPLSPR